MIRRLGWYLLIVGLSAGLGGWGGFRKESEICAALDDNGVAYTDCDLGPVYAVLWAGEAVVVALVVIVIVEVGIRLVGPLRGDSDADDPADVEA